MARWDAVDRLREQWQRQWAAVLTCIKIANGDRRMELAAVDELERSMCVYAAEQDAATRAGSWS